MKINSKSKDLNINNNYNKNMKSYLNFSLGLFLIIILSSGVMADGDITFVNTINNNMIVTPGASPSRSLSQGGTWLLNLTVNVTNTTGNVPLNNVTFAYRIGTSGAFSPINFSAVNATGGNLSYRLIHVLFNVTNLTNTRNLEINVTSYLINSSHNRVINTTLITGIDIDWSAPNSTTLTLERDRVEILNPVEFSCKGIEDIDTSLDLRTFLFRPDTTQLSSSSVNDTDNEVTSTFSGEDIDQRGEYSILCSSTNDANFTTNSSLIAFNVLSESDDDPLPQPPSQNPIQLSNAWLVFIIVSVLVVIFVFVLIALTYSKKKR